MSRLPLEMCLETARGVAIWCGPRIMQLRIHDACIQQTRDKWCSVAITVVINRLHEQVWSDKIHQLPTLDVDQAMLVVTAPGNETLGMSLQANHSVTPYVIILLTLSGDILHVMRLKDALWQDWLIVQMSSWQVMLADQLMKCLHTLSQSSKDMEICTGFLLKNCPYHIYLEQQRHTSNRLTLVEDVQNGELKKTSAGLALVLTRHGIHLSSLQWWCCS